MHKNYKITNAVWAEINPSLPKANEAFYISLPEEQVELNRPQDFIRTAIKRIFNTKILDFDFVEIV